MGFSFSALFNLWRAKEVRCVMIGLDAAGKTTTLNRLKLGENMSTIPTIGFNVDTVKYKNIELNVWDVGGQVRLRSLWHHYYNGCSVVIFVVDSADRERIKEAGEELARALEADELRNATLLVFANKQDLPGAMPTAEVAERMKLSATARNRKWWVQGCTATTGNGLYEGLDWVATNLPKDLPK